MKPESSLGEVFSSSKNSLIADICQSLVIDLFAPAGVLIDQNGDRIHTIGSPHRYLGVAEEYLGRDVLALASPEIRFGIESTIERAKLEDARVVSVPHQVIGRGQALSFRIAARPFLAEGEPLVLVCFIDEPAAGETPSAAGRSTSEIAILRQELSDTRTELRRAIRNLEISSEEHKAITEESVATNEEYQSSNDQLIASKGELKFLNDELMAVNFQLYEIIERQRTSTNDLEDILFSTDIATLFLDADLNIRLFSPSIASFFHILPGDIGRPLADLRSLATDEALLDDVRTTLESRVPIEREIKTDRALWYTRRVSPYRSRANNARGVVLTFSDVTERKHAAFAVESALRQAEEASLSKSRFLSTVSHDLRQPMQTFALIQGLLAKTTLKASEQRLVMKLDQTLQTMLSTVNALIDMSRIDTGSINPEIRAFPIHDLLVAIEQRPAFHEEGRHLHVVPCALVVNTDGRLLTQMVEHLVWNAWKTSAPGAVLLGCRRRGAMLSIEIWQSSSNKGDERGQGLARGAGPSSGVKPGPDSSLDLTLARRMANVLHHRIGPRSTTGKSSGIAIEAPLVSEAAAPPPSDALHRPDDLGRAREGRFGSLLVIEANPVDRELLGAFLEGERFVVATAADGFTALDLVERGSIWPDLIVADYHLPNGMNGLEAAIRLRERIGPNTPIIVVTGEGAADAEREIGTHNFLRLQKPVRTDELIGVIRRLLRRPGRAARPPVSRGDTLGAPGSPIIIVVEDDDETRSGLRAVLQEDGWTVDAYASAEEFLRAHPPAHDACLLIDAQLPGMSGLELLRSLKEARRHYPAIMISGKSGVSVAVQAMKAGASDFIEKPVRGDELIASVRRELGRSHDIRSVAEARKDAVKQFVKLTLREREVMKKVLAGHSNKNIAAELNLSQRTVENHRASVMKKTGSKSLPALARLALAAEWIGADEAPRQATSG